MIKITPRQEHDMLLSSANRYDEEGDTERARMSRDDAYDIAVQEGWEGPDGPVDVDPSPDCRCEMCPQGGPYTCISED
jgi:hypothetical protein